MVYQGSKNRLSKYIVPILQDCIDKNNCDTFIDLFCGGCNIIDKIKCENRINMYKIIYGAAMRGRYKPDGTTRQHLESRFDEFANAITSINTDCMVIIEKRCKNVN